MIKIRKSIFILFLIVVLFVPILYANAGAPKLIFETAEGTTKAMIKAIEARKGFKVIDGTGDTVKSSEVFTQSIAKEMQETAIDSWNVINGGVFDSTPLKGLPGWSKVVIGTVAFVIGADIAFDIYNKIQNGESIEYLTKENTNAENTVTNGFYYDLNDYKMVKNKYRYYLKWYGYETNSYVDTRTKVISYVIKDIYPEKYDNYELKTKYRVWLESGNIYDLESRIDIDLLPDFFDTLVNIGKSLLPKEDIKIESVPEVDTNKPTVTLIVPDPEFFPDINGAILENWDMVSNPDKWLEEHPDHDPTPEPKPEIPIPEFEPVIPDIPQPKYIPNPDYNPDLLPSVDNPRYIPNPDYKPDKPPVIDPTGQKHFDPITGEDKGVQEVPIVDLQSFFLRIKTHFDNKYPIFSDLYNMYKIKCEVCNSWEGITTSGIKIGNQKLGEIVIVDSSFVNEAAPKIKLWITGIIWFFLGLYLIRKMSTVWGSGK